MSKPIVVFYHRADFDGIFCREIARKFLPDAELIGWDYGDPVPELVPTPNQLYILDLSIPELMNHPNLIWIDHHKSAIDKYGTGKHYHCIDGVAACRLCWSYFTGSTVPSRQDFIDRRVSEPYAVRLAGEYDIWDKRDPNAELFQHGLRSRELTSVWWSEMLRLDGDSNGAVIDLLQRGEAVRYAQQQADANTVTNRSFTVEFEGLRFLALNTARCNSLTFAAAIKPEHDALMGFFWNGTVWNVSLYHAPRKEHHDLSAIAVKYGGGGHRGACGFRTNKLPFLP